jgi:hypothetical protein
MTDPFTPANLLEIALKNATENPASRPAFYRELLDSKVVIIPAGEPPLTAGGAVPEGTQIKLARVALDGRPTVPFFTSEQRLPSTAKRYLLLSARSFFEMTRGVYLVMNPGSPLGKEFVPDEVTRLLDGSLFQPQERYVTPKATQVMIGQPGVYPDELARALTGLYETLPAVRRAWLGFYHNPARDAEGGLLVALDVEPQDMDRVVGESGIVIDSIPKKHHFVDLVRYEGRGVSAYFSSQKPFYQKSPIKSLWARITGAG